MSFDETVSIGSNSSEQVVRVGSTVRRSMEASSTTVYRFLTYLSDGGFHKAPQFLGIDDQGREILSFMEEDCSTSPEHWQSNKYLTSAAVLLREFHDVSSSYDTNDQDC